MASDIERQMASVKGVIKMDTSLVTGSILTYFDPAITNVDFIIGYLNSAGRFRDVLPHTTVRKEKGESVGVMVEKTVIQSVIKRSGVIHIKQGKGCLHGKEGKIICRCDGNISQRCIYTILKSHAVATPP